MTVPTDHDPLDIVSTQSLECELKLVGGAAAGSLSGVFGPRSITWQVDREAAIFLGAGRALLLQLAHPWISAAVEQHSDTFANPIGRFHRTFGTIFTMVFGTLAQSFDAARRLHRRHASIEGTLQTAAGPFPAGSSYCANEVSALLWVHATLVETAAYDREPMESVALDIGCLDDRTPRLDVRLYQGRHQVQSWPPVHAGWPTLR